MERSRMWRDVKWTVLGGGKLRAQESEGIGAGILLGARAAKHRQMPEAPTRPWICVLERAQPDLAKLKGQVRIWGQCQGKSCSRCGAGWEGVPEVGRKRARLRWAIAQNAILPERGSRTSTVPRQLEGQSVLASSLWEATSLWKWQ